MYTGLLLICLLGSPNDCHVEASPKFFDTFEQCEATNEGIKDKVNSARDLPVFISNAACVAWGETV